MTTHHLFVFSNPTEGREDDYNEWYDNTHLAEVLQVPGIVAAQRYQVATTLAGSLPHRYLAVYDIEGDDPTAALTELGKAAGGMNMSDAYDAGGAVVVVFTAAGERQTAKSGTTGG